MTSLTIYIALVILVPTLLIWFFSWIKEKKDLAEYKKLALFNVYHCPKCNAVYTDYSKDKKADCPSCKKTNISLRF